MAETMTLTVAKRTETGKNHNRRLREEKKIPAVFYDAKDHNEPVVADMMQLWKLYEKAGSTQVFTLKIDDNGSTKEYPTLLWKIEFHPFKNMIMHADFLGVDMTKEMTIQVPVVLEGDPVGVNEGGVLQQMRFELTVSCKAGDIPEAIHLDVSNLNINDSISITDIVPPANVSLVFDEEDHFAVAGVVPPMAEVEEGAAEGEEAAEPEVIGQGEAGKAKEE